MTLVPSLKAIFWRPQQAVHLGRDLAVHPGQDAVEELDHRDLGAEAAPDRAHFEPDVAAADHRHARRHLWQGQRTGGGNDALLVHLDAAERGGDAAGRDHYCTGRDSAGLRTLDLDRAGACEAGVALQVGHVVLLQQASDALGERVHDLVLVRHHRIEIELDARDLDAMTGEPRLGVGVFLRRVQQRLGRDAADVEAGAAESGRALDAGRAQPELSRADGGDVAAGAGADHQDVEVMFAHGCSGWPCGTKDQAGCVAGPRCNP